MKGILKYLGEKWWVESDKTLYRVIPEPLLVTKLVHNKKVEFILVNNDMGIRNSIPVAKILPENKVVQMGVKPFYVYNIKELIHEYDGGEISLSKVVEELNRIAKEFYEHKRPQTEGS